MRLKRYLNEAKEEEPVKFKGKFVYGDEDMMVLTPELVKKRRGKHFPLSEFPNATFKAVLVKKKSYRTGNEYYVWELAAFDGNKLIDVYNLSAAGNVQGRYISTIGSTEKYMNWDKNRIVIPKGMKPKKYKAKAGQYDPTQKSNVKTILDF